MRRKYGLPLVFLMMAAFWACSDDVVSEKNEYDATDDVSSVKGIDDLPDCEDENDGAMYWVSSEKSFRICRDEEWFAVKPVKGDTVETKVSCKAEKLQDGSGMKVICNGDSVGVLLNGTDADSVVNLDSLLSDSALLAELLDLNLIEKHSEGQEIELDSEQVVVNLEDVSGFSQKGPFLLGSEVVAYELENGRTLKQTGKQFHGKISDDKGSFNIRTIKVASQYAFLAAKGFYRNEVSGKVSGQQITLNALTDLRNRNVVNINVLTHLEYDRIVQLVTKDGYTVRKAKKKAEEEIFGNFYMDSLNIDGVSEDFSIIGDGAGDAALLAISVLLQRNLTEAVMQSQITSMSEAIAKDGKWNNDSLKMAMADWVSRLELTDGMKVIRENVKGWNLSDNEPPAFEPLLHHFWVKAYGIGECTENRIGELFAVDNKYSENYNKKSTERFICVDSSNKDVGYTWRYATEIEKDTYNWSAGSSDGALKKGDLTDTMYVYDAEKKKWNFATPIDEQHGGCRQELYGKIKRLGEYNVFYRCEESSRSWVPVYNYAEIDTQGWGAGEDGETRWGDTLGVSVVGRTICYSGYPSKGVYTFTSLNDSIYYSASDASSLSDDSGCSCKLRKYQMSPGEVLDEDLLLYEGADENVELTYCNSGKRACYYYDTADEKWISVSSEQCDDLHSIGPCTAKNIGEMKYSEPENRVYECTNYRDEYYGRSYIQWEEVTDEALANAFYEKCDEDKWITGFFDQNVHFVCADGKWRKASVTEEYAGAPCFLSDQTLEKEVNGEVLICINSDWRTRDDVVANTYNQECDEDKWILGSYAPDLHFVCDYTGEKHYWRKTEGLEEELGEPCYYTIMGQIKEFGGARYKCYLTGWGRWYQ